ncbi:hypothetical protein Btru_037630 [Bulinus truncatus]|nr:hypothetical protein Btru_037630 [Bulinus truncatus]
MYDECFIYDGILQFHYVTKSSIFNTFESGITMKTIVVLLAILAVSAAQLLLGDMIHSAVDSLLASTPNMSVQQCTDSCDMLFELIHPLDESQADDLCRHACEWFITEPDFSWESKGGWV